jgi:hypothetical protein
MRYEITKFKADVEFTGGSDEEIDEGMLRSAIERQVVASLGLDAEVVYVSPFEVTTREVIRCEFCEKVDTAATQQRPALWDGAERLEHACNACLSEHADVLRRVV